MTKPTNHPFTAGADVTSFNRILRQELQELPANDNFNLGSGEMFLVAEADVKKNKMTGRTCVCVCVANEKVTEEGVEPAEYRIKFELVKDEKEKEVKMYPVQED